ncbi:hypothetical protein P153DRAFT_371547 [Dothidotthia symphoricarpi CBS 119687]|uniref:Uncharacterized protein n=1 Tax=Dothidotthia symphoricarpi CBS 119687 TaxID=1392245 RepID=A0A6A5ZXC6_9PLEO|nr:uncharacterized protein P153DRAFT_371547 [Dothidotthia symphoricarpi CBS 119687]KAF2123564.1 hypothetical protein P153DRAFT_371547 [Dothidotthia symphoricarpi CBS 119687]
MRRLRKSTGLGTTMVSLAKQSVGEVLHLRLPCRCARYQHAFQLLSRLAALPALPSTTVNHERFFPTLARQTIVRRRSDTQLSISSILTALPVMSSPALPAIRRSHRVATDLHRLAENDPPARIHTTLARPATCTFAPKIVTSHTDLDEGVLYMVVAKRRDSAVETSHSLDLKVDGGELAYTAVRTSSLHDGVTGGVADPAVVDEDGFARDERGSAIGHKS